MKIKDCLWQLQKFENFYILFFLNKRIKDVNHIQIMYWKSPNKVTIFTFAIHTLQGNYLQNSRRLRMCVCVCVFLYMAHIWKFYLK